MPDALIITDATTALVISVTNVTLIVVAIVGSVCWLLGNKEKPLPVDDETW